MQTIGEKLSPVLEEIENTLLEHQVNVQTQPKFTNDGFRAVTKIFIDVLLDKMWELQKAENIPQTDRENMATKAGEDIRKLIKVYTNIDTYKLYN